MRKYLFLLLSLLLCSCSVITVNRPVVDREYQQRQRKAAEQLKQSIPFTVLIRDDCKNAKPNNPGTHRQWLGWRYGWRKVPNEIAVMCLTPEQARKLMPPQGAECHP